MNDFQRKHPHVGSTFASVLTAINMILLITWEMQSRYNIGMRGTRGA